VGIFGRRKGGPSPALHEMPVAPGVGKVRAHATAGGVNIRYDTVKGPAPEALFARLFGSSAPQAAELGRRAWEEGVKFRVYTPEKAAAPKGSATPVAAPAPVAHDVPVERVVKRLDIGERVSILAIESEKGGSLGRAVPLYWTDLTHTCEPNWAKRFQGHLGAWVEGNVDSPSGSEPLGFEALDFAWHRAVYLRGAAMPLEIAAVSEKYEPTGAPQQESVKAVVYPGGKASDPDEFDLVGTILSVTEAKHELGSGLIIKLRVEPLEWIDLWVRASDLRRTPRIGEGAEARARLFGLWAGQRTSDLSVG
jgi:hypothetical protein